MASRRFSEMPAPGKAATIALGAVSVALIAFAERDLQRRPARQIRGPRLLWRLVSLNAVGALGYLRWGRR